jgi:hypothetical protein
MGECTADDIPPAEAKEAPPNVSSHKSSPTSKVEETFQFTMTDRLEFNVDCGDSPDKWAIHSANEAKTGGSLVEGPESGLFVN